MRARAGPTGKRASASRKRHARCRAPRAAPARRRTRSPLPTRDATSHRHLRAPAHSSPFEPPGPSVLPFLRLALPSASPLLPPRPTPPTPAPLPPVLPALIYLACRGRGVQREAVDPPSSCSTGGTRDFGRSSGRGACSARSGPLGRNRSEGTGRTARGVDLSLRDQGARRGGASRGRSAARGAAAAPAACRPSASPLRMSPSRTKSVRSRAVYRSSRPFSVRADRWPISSVSAASMKRRRCSASWQTKTT